MTGKGVRKMSLIDQTILNRYRVRSLLGEGAMGAVYLADDLELKRQVALKVLRHELASRPDVVQRLDNECQIMARLGSHPNIVTLYDRLVWEEHVILVMEYVPGETLSDLIARTHKMNSTTEAGKRTISWDEQGIALAVLKSGDALELAKQCLTGLEFAHSRGVLHRDIKPDNIRALRDHNGRLQAKIMDFGISKALFSEGADGGPMLTQVGMPGPGTPAYMAPEQIDPQRFGAVGAAADLYAFGITLYQMLTLTLPFEGTYTELLNAHTNIEPPDPQTRNVGITDAMRQVLMKALRKNQDERYSSAQDFRIDLEAIGGGGGTVVMNTPTGSGARGTRPTPLPHTLKPPQPVSNRPQWLWGAVGLFVILLAGGGAAFFVTNKKSDSPVPPPDNQKTVLQPVASPAPTVLATPVPTVPPGVETPQPVSTPVSPAPAPVVPVPAVTPTPVPVPNSVYVPDPRKDLETRWGLCVGDYKESRNGVREENLDNLIQQASSAGYMDLAERWEKEKAQIRPVSKPAPTPLPVPPSAPEPTRKPTSEPAPKPSKPPKTPKATPTPKPTPEPIEGLDVFKWKSDRRV
jgi:serine/threonine protein kinase